MNKNQSILYLVLTFVFIGLSLSINFIIPDYNVWFIIVFALLSFIAFLFVGSKANKVKVGLDGVEVEKLVEKNEKLLIANKDLIAILIRSTMTGMAYAGRLGGVSVFTQVDIYHKLRNIATEVNFSQSELDEIIFEFRKMYLRDHFGLVHKLSNEIEPLKELKSRYYDIMMQRIVRPDELDIEVEKIMRDVDDSAKDELKNFLLDYKYFFENMKYRRPEKWLEN